MFSGAQRGNRCFEVLFKGCSGRHSQERTWHVTLSWAHLEASSKKLQKRASVSLNDAEMLMVNVLNICSLKPGAAPMHQSSCAGFEVSLCHALCNMCIVSVPWASVSLPGNAQEKIPTPKADVRQELLCVCYPLVHG